MTKQLSILHSESSCGWGGQEIRILSECRGMLDRGHQVELLCPSHANIYQAALDYDIPVHGVEISKKKFTHLKTLNHWWKQHGSRFDVVNTHSSTDSWLVALVNQWAAKHLPIVRTRHVSTAVNQSWATRWLYQSATDYIVTTGEALRLQLHQDNGYTLENMLSVPTGVDLSVFYSKPHAKVREQLSLDHNKKIIGIVATLRDWKGHSYLFKAFKAISPQLHNTEIIVVGDGPYEDRLRTLVNELGLDDLVHFQGRQDNVADWLNAFDYFCLPSYGEEGVPQALMQAMVCGLPVISTPVGSIAELIKDGETGLMVQKQDIDSLASALLKLIQDDILCETLGQKAKEHVQQNFSRTAMLDAMEQVFYQVVGK